MVTEVQQLTNRVDRGEVILKIPSIVIAECCWVLESYYGYRPPAIADAIRKIVNAKGIDTEEKNLVLVALDDYVNEYVDYIDAFIAAKAQNSPHPHVTTWNEKHFKRLRVQHTKPHHV
ncbi:PIN domain-containing protein [Alicyclobacillus sp. ALC3]|uniref:PIN domain-containing protein n=1 Tax=Alicyclobacillus sp. ALC3 TaxID=2796143 RepID=UPI0023796CC4|nr:type II toxin-antitoxin system VapC family toxin [Alicyclobacillus sp. ALC3]